MATVSGVAAVKITRGGVVFNLSVATDVTPLFLESTDLDFGDNRTRKAIDTVIFDMTNQSLQSNLTLTIKYRNNLADALQSWNPVGIGVEGNPVFLRPPAARYYRIRLDDIAVLERYTIGRMTFFGYPAGRRF